MSNELELRAIQAFNKADSRKKFISQFHGKTISEIKYTGDMWNLYIEEITFTDGTVISLSGYCDYCVIDSVEGSDGEQIEIPEEDAPEYEPNPYLPPLFSAEQIADFGKKISEHCSGVGRVVFADDKDENNAKLLEDN